MLLRVQNVMHLTRCMSGEQGSPKGNFALTVQSDAGLMFEIVYAGCCEKLLIAFYSLR